MLEYRIIRQNRNGKPFSLWTFDNFEACYCKLLDMINNTGDCFSKDYYVFNDFYNNECLPSALIKFKIECREVGEWKVYSLEKEKESYEKITKIY